MKKFIPLLVLCFFPTNVKAEFPYLPPAPPTIFVKEACEAMGNAMCWRMFDCGLTSEVETPFYLCVDVFRQSCCTGDECNEQTLTTQHELVNCLKYTRTMHCGSLAHNNLANVYFACKGIAQAAPIYKGNE